MERARKIGIVAAGLALASIAVYALVHRSAPADEGAAAPAIPIAPPSARGASSAPGEAEVAAAYHAWLAKDPRAKALFADILDKPGQRVENGLPDYAEIVVAATGPGVLVRGQTKEAGTLFADGESGAILAWTSQGQRGVGGDSFGALLFEEQSAEQAALFDARAKRALGELPGAPLAASSDGTVVVYSVSDEDDAGVGVILKVWGTPEGRDRRALRAPGTLGVPTLGVSMGGDVAAVSRDGRYAAALVDDSAARVMIWDVTNGKVVASQPLDRPQLIAAFSADNKGLFTTAWGMTPSGEAEDGFVRIRLSDGAVDGPVFACSPAHASAGARSIAQSPDGKLVALGGTEETCIFQASPLRLLWKTPVLRAAGSTDDDLGGTFPSFVLGGRALLVESEGPPSWALYRLGDRAELARAAVFADPRDAAPVTSLVTDGRVVLMLEDPAGPVIVDVDPSVAVKKRPLTPDEQSGTTQPPELASAPAGGADPTAREDAARAAIAKRVCHTGDIVIPIEMCP